MTMNDNLVNLNLIVGFLSPILIAVINNPKWSKNARVAIMVGVSIIVGFATTWFTGNFNAEDIIGSILLIAVSSITAYNGVFKPTGISDAIETTTSKTKPAPEKAEEVKDDVIESPVLIQPSMEKEEVSERAG